VSIAPSKKEKSLKGNNASKTKGIWSLLEGTLEPVTAEKKKIRNIVRHSRALQKKDFRKKGISEYCET
jgi:hypothetical protein